MAQSAYRPFVCSICLNDYKDPKFLTCFHSFCQQCLKDCFEVKKADSIKCPLCRTITPMPEDGVKGLSNNIYLEQGTSSKGGKLYCGFCCSNFIAEFRCRDCADYLCIQCKGQHMQMKQTKGHILELVEDEGPLREHGIETCKVHATSEVLFACYECNKECCSECWKTMHNDHKIGPLTEVARAMRQTVRKCIEETKTKLVDIVQEKADIMVEKNRITTLIHHTEIEIDNIGVELKERIDRVTGNMKREMRETGEALDHQILTSLNINDDKSKVTKARIESTTEVLNKASNVVILALGRDLRNSLVNENAKAPADEQRTPKVVVPDVESAVLKCLGDHTDSLASNILHPTVDGSIVHSITLKAKHLTAITCLANDCVLVCDKNKKTLHQLTVEGDRLGAFKARYRIEDVAQLSDGSVMISSYNGKRISKFWLEGNYVDNRKMEGYTLGVSLTYSGNELILCCSDIKKDRSHVLPNCRLLVMSPELEILQRHEVPSGREVVRRACQNRNGDFVAITSRRCFVLRNTGRLKFIYKFIGLVHSVGTISTAI